MIACPKCNRIVMDSTPEGGYKLRSRMTFFKDGKATALCPSCKCEVDVPITLNVADMPAKQPKLLVKI